MTPRRRLALAAAGVVVVAVVALVAFRPAGDQKQVTGAAPAFTTEDLDGRTVRLADFRGQPVLLNFWASWCVPCRNEFPLFREVDESKVAVLGVVFRDTPAAAADFMRHQGATWPGLVDPSGRIARSYGVDFRPGLPVTVAVDRRGVLAGRHVGELRREDLDALVAAASR